MCHWIKTLECHNYKKCYCLAIKVCNKYKFKNTRVKKRLKMHFEGIRERTIKKHWFVTEYQKMVTS